MNVFPNTYYLPLRQQSEFMENVNNSNNNDLQQSASTTSSPVSGNGIGTKAGSDDGCYCSSDMSSEQSNNLLLLNASSLPRTIANSPRNMCDSLKPIRMALWNDSRISTAHQHHRTIALLMFDLSLFSFDVLFSSARASVYSSILKRTVGRHGSSTSSSLSGSSPRDGHRSPCGCQYFFLQRARQRMSLGKVSRRHWACMHIRIRACHWQSDYLSLVRRNDHNPSCVCYSMAVTDARRSEIEVDHFSLSLRPSN